MNASAIPLSYVAMNRAMACLSCSSIFDIRHGTCPACADEHVIPVETWLYSLKETTT